jgi:cytochrome c556
MSDPTNPEAARKSAIDALEAEWMDQHEFNDYTNWLQDQFMKLRATALEQKRDAVRACEEIAEQYCGDSTARQISAEISKLYPECFL